ncbi:MAG TPA: hypothetical protein VFO10_22950 [Oligoflexus sp.]|uniref:hypothetical protein n=1 Tax=Oligoflexus sp. TaxID=1971216 RepID=UPI002D7F2010|nr:hypothetical protein [Oligoflexus sp.]HET9240140.1 hypothetical protein [Oligoflexus sp.]
MLKLVSSSWKVLLPLQLAACGSDTPSFQERPQALIKVAVNKADDPSQMSGESFDIDTLDADDDTFGSADATADEGPGANPNENSFAKPVSSRDSTALPGRPAESNRGPIEDAAAGGGGSSHATPSMPIPDTKAVAKACAPAMKNLGKPMTVVTVQDTDTAITISPNSVVALKIVGDRTKVVLDLDATTPLLGLCFFLAGHETELQFTTASAVQSLALIEAGDQARAQVTLTGGSSESLSVDLRGHNPSLAIQGVNAELCAAAEPRKANVTFQCRP